MSKKEKNEEEKPNTHEELKGFNIHINEFGEIISSYSVDKLNKFLDENVEDKKLKDRDDLNEEK
ncbi:MAG: hypothetical protein MK212_20255 [Saprospiraceae bacterium]|nr:hypothetical protein [Saprospiraceae bacterium]